MAAPQILVDLVNSLQLTGVPTTAAPGDRISPRVTPHLGPGPGGLPNATLESLSRTEILADVVADLAPIVDYLARTLGVDASVVLKAVEFNKPVEGRADLVDVSSATVRDLPHLVPRLGVPGNPLELSQYVEGLIGRARARLDFQRGTVPSQVTALIRKPAVLASVPTVSLTFRVVDEVGNPAVPGTHFFASTTPFVPDFVFLPVVVDPSGNPPATVRRSFFCDVTITYTPVGGSQETLTRTLGPASVDLATTQVPLIAVLTEHAVGDSRFPGRVFVGVPGNSPLGDASTAFASLAQISTALSSLTTVLGLIGVPVPGSISAAASAITRVTGLAPGRFRQGDLIGFWELFNDWQYIFSSIILFGPSSRRAFLGGFAGNSIVGFDVFPSVLGVVDVPDLTAFPLAPSVGTANQLFPSAPTAPPGGSFNDLSTSINFPFP